MTVTWSSRFTPTQLADPPLVALRAPISAEWALAGGDGAGVRVGIVDSGVDATHPAVGGLAGGVALSVDPGSDGDVLVAEGPHEDLTGHGTACAGIIRKAAPAAELYSIRVLGERLTGKARVFAAGLRWAIENGMQVVNLSLSTHNPEYFGLFHELADLAYFRRIMLVAAVNNVPKPSYPSEYAAVFSVAAREGADPFQLDYNAAPPVEFGAPGINVDVAWLNHGTSRVTGNSFAAPHVAGLIARILGKHPGLTPFQMKTILHSLATAGTSADPLPRG